MTSSLSDDVTRDRRFMYGGSNSMHCYGHGGSMTYSHYQSSSHSSQSCLHNTHNGFSYTGKGFIFALKRGRKLNVFVELAQQLSSWEQTSN